MTHTVWTIVAVAIAVGMFIAWASYRRAARRLDRFVIDLRTIDDWEETRAALSRAAWEEHRQSLTHTTDAGHTTFGEVLGVALIAVALVLAMGYAGWLEGAGL